MFEQEGPLNSLSRAMVRRNTGGWPQPTEPQPSIEEIMDMEWERGGCEATDGCFVEPDGMCHHGHPSWMIRMGLL